jgi:HEAT repeat protein
MTKTGRTAASIAPGPHQRLVQDLKGALSRTEVRASEIIGEIASRFAANALALLKRAARGSEKREHALLGLLMERGDEGCEISDQFVRGVIADKRHVARSAAIQIVAFNPRRLRFAATLREIAKDASDPDWASAVSSLGQLKDLDALDVLMAHTRGQATPFVVIAALVRLKCPEAVLVFEPNLTHPEARTRTYALWGLAALKYEVAIGALVHLLDDPDIQTPGGFEPGQSQRAAQALAEIHGWPFEWGDRSSFEAVRQRCRERYSDAFVQRCLSTLAKGRLQLLPLGRESRS